MSLQKMSYCGVPAARSACSFGIVCSHGWKSHSTVAPVFSWKSLANCSTAGFQAVPARPRARMVTPSYSPAWARIVPGRMAPKPPRAAAPPVAPAILSMSRRESPFWIMVVRPFLDGGHRPPAVSGCGRDLRPGTPGMEDGEPLVWLVPSPFMAIRRFEAPGRHEWRRYGWFAWSLRSSASKHDWFARKGHFGIEGEDGPRDLLPGQ